ncbi:MAG TPA: adenylate/guanylate cyclase domain-containing protein [Usitatibacter sp.]|nr:adenylate/guanylate cyclase domain-containing protein [Usitatibacter sp.]
MQGPTTEYPNALALGSMLMEYRLESVLGVGGFGITYLASDTLLEKQVAIKEYFPSAAVSRLADGSVAISGPNLAVDFASGLDRFLKEARTLAGFSHPHIVRVNRYFRANETGYMVMDYEDGESLKAWLQRQPALPADVLKGLLAPLLDGIEKVHSAGFLHRDIKPDNIFVRKRGDPVVIDFGSARQAISGTTHTLTTLVTPGYAPFEQYATGQEQGPWTDIYALGAVLFFAVTGRNPPDAIARMKGDALENLLAPALVQYGEELVHAIVWAMKLDEKARPQTVGEWREKIFGRVLVGVATVPDLAPSPMKMRASTSSDAAETDTQDISHLLARREELDRAVKDKFQRVLTVMFTDLKGSTAIAETSGDFAVRAMLKRYHDLCGEAIKANGGTLVKTIGDGSLSHFTDSLAACRAAAAIQRGMEQINLSKQYKSLLLARIGLHTGECILEKNDVFGDVVNTASRFESSAHPGEILISEDTYNALSDKNEFYARFDRDVTLKGKSMPFKAYVIFWDPKEIEVDRARPLTGTKPSTPLWKIATWVGVPLLAILGAAFYITAGGKIGGESTRSINYSVPSK